MGYSPWGCRESTTGRNNSNNSYQGLRFRLPWLNSVFVLYLCSFFNSLILDFSFACKRGVTEGWTCYAHRGCQLADGFGFRQVGLDLVWQDHSILLGDPISLAFSGVLSWSAWRFQVYLPVFSGPKARRELCGLKWEWKISSNALFCFCFCFVFYCFIVLCLSAVPGSKSAICMHVSPPPPPWAPHPAPLGHYKTPSWDSCALQ